MTHIEFKVDVWSRSGLVVATPPQRRGRSMRQRRRRSTWPTRPRRWPRTSPRPPRPPPPARPPPRPPPAQRAPRSSSGGPSSRRPGMQLCLPRPPRCGYGTPGPASPPVCPHRPVHRGSVAAPPAPAGPADAPCSTLPRLCCPASPRDSRRVGSGAAATVVAPGATANPVNPYLYVRISLSSKPSACLHSLLRSSKLFLRMWYQMEVIRWMILWSRMQTRTWISLGCRLLLPR